MRSRARVRLTLVAVCALCCLVIVSVGRNGGRVGKPRPVPLEDGFRNLYVHVTTPHLPTTEPVGTDVTLSDDISIRGNYQQKRIDEFCRRHNWQDRFGKTPEDPEELELLHRHLLFSDRHETIYCFVEKTGCSNLKRLMFVASGVLSQQTAQWDWVDNSVMERSIGRGSFLRKNLTTADRTRRLEQYFKFASVRSPLERLVSGYRNKMASPLRFYNKKTAKFDELKEQILSTYRPLDFRNWLSSGRKGNITVTFSDFVQYVVDTDNAKLNPHFKPVIDTCHPCRVRYQYYLSFKNYGSDARAVIRRMGAEESFFHDKPLHSEGDRTVDLLDSYYNQLSIRLKRELFFDFRDELDFYYSLYPEERHSHMTLLGVSEAIM